MTGGAKRIWPRLVGVLLLAVPFLPLQQLFGPLEGAQALVPPGEWILGLAIFGVVSWLVTATGGGVLEGAGRWPIAIRPGTDRLWISVGLVAMTGVLMSAAWFAFDGSPINIDSVIQLFQARIFADGSLAAPAPAEDGFFTTQHMIVDDQGWYSQYAPGHSALLTLGMAAGEVWLVPVVLSLATALLLCGVSTRVWGRTTGRLTLLLTLLSPYFWFMGASFMNHVSALFFVAVFLYLFVRWQETWTTVRAVAAGAALGAAAIIRPLTAVAVLVPFAAFVLLPGPGEPHGVGPPGDGAEAGGQEEGREGGSLGLARRARLLLAAGLGFALLGSLYLAYNAAVTGDPLLPGYLKLWGAEHGIGFHATPWGGEHTPLAGLRNELIDLSLLNLFLFEWPVPALLPVGAVFALGWAGGTWDRRLLIAFLAVPVAYAFYWHRDAFLGPRFLYGGLAFLLPLTARSLLVATEKLRGHTVHLWGLFHPAPLHRWAGVFLGLCMAYGVFFGVPQRFRVYATGMQSMKLDLHEQAAQAGIDRGLVFVKVSWGNRILARLRAMGVSAPTAEKVYRGIGHCRLHGLIEEAVEANWDSARIDRELSRALARDEELMKTVRLNGDPTLRISADGEGLTDACEEEIAYDRRGYTLFSPHLVVNDPRLSGTLVVARDLREENARLMARYPGRPAYLFDGERFVPIGRANGPGTVSP